MSNSHSEPQTASLPEATPSTKAFPPIYPRSLKESTELGETALWHENLHLNIECAHAISAAINDHYNDYTLGGDTAAPVIEKYGMERLQYVLANHVQLTPEYDVRISRISREWAKNFSFPDDKMERSSFIINNHPGLIDLLVRQVQRMDKERSKTPAAPTHKPQSKKNRDRDSR